MGRFVLQVVQRLLTRDDVSLVLCSRDKADRAALQLLLGHPDRWDFATWTQWTRRDRGQVSWFPWNRVDIEPASPRVVTIHDTAAFDWPKRGLTAFIDNRRAQSQLREAVRRARRVMTVSRFSADCLRRHLGVADVDVVVEGESLARYAETVKTRPRPRPYLLYVGAEDARKNLDGLPAAWDRIRDPGRDLVVAGCAGQAREGLHFSGETDDVALAGLYRWCDLFVMPSFYEGFGLPLLEAMACGAPVAAARAASLPEVGGDVPAWFDPHDVDDIARVLADILTDDARRERMRTEGRERARAFTWDIAADQVVACLRNCVSQAS